MYFSPPLSSPSPATCDLLATSEDSSPDSLWVWEVRDLKKALPGAAKAATRKMAEAFRKRRKEVSNPLRPLSNLLLLE